VITPAQQSGAKNQNLAHIIESFKKEKFAFNERFSELKKRLDTFNNKRTGQHHPGLEGLEGHFNRTAPMYKTLNDEHPHRAYNPVMLHPNY